MTGVYWYGGLRRRRHFTDNVHFDSEAVHLAARRGRIKSWRQRERKESTAGRDTSVGPSEPMGKATKER